MEESYDLMILGGGIAGMTAAIYATRYNLKTVVIGQEFGGTGNLAGFVENWPGFKGPGMDLMSKIYEQAKESGAFFLQGEITAVSKNGENFSASVNVDSEERILNSKAVVISLGMQHRKLNVKGEKELLGKGVSYCATCDGMFFKGKDVLVIGGADSAAKAALYLSEIARKVYVSYRQAEMRCEPVSLDKLKNRENVEITYFSNPVEILGEKKVTGITLEQENDGEKKIIQLDVDGIFIEIGAVPVTEVIKQLGVEITPAGFIIIDRDSKTNVEGIFAAGDNTDNKFKQLVVASSEGALAAKSAYDYLRFRK